MMIEFRESTVLVPSLILNHGATVALAFPSGGVLMIVSDRMTKNPVTISPEDTLVSAQEKMRAGGFRQIPVLDKERLVGIITDRDIRRHGRHNIVARVQSVMTEGVISITPEIPIEEAARILLEHKIGGLPVVENEQLVGIISTTDILRAFVDLLASTRGNASPSGI